MNIIHIKATKGVDDKILSEIMNILIKNNFDVEKYLSATGKIVMAREKNENWRIKYANKKVWKRIIQFNRDK